MTDKIIAYKAFDANMQCRGFQYEVGKTYRHEGDVSLCNSGFHACLHPLDVLNYYPTTSRFALVEMTGAQGEQDCDTKVCAAEITIKAELHIDDMVEAAVSYVFDAAKWIKQKAATGPRGAASATGYSGAASATGYSGAASATGYSGAASATGYRGAASATGYKGAASATSYKGAASATGDSGAASATGYRGTAMACGYNGRAMGADGCALFLCERDMAGKILSVWSGIAGRDGVKPMTWYALKGGKPEEVSQ